MERSDNHLEQHQEIFHSALKKLETENLTSRLWDKDPTLWKTEPEHQAVIRERLGWLTVVHSMKKEADAIHKFALEVKGEGFKHAVLLGMGGSSLCPEVFKITFGKIEGFPELHVLDSTDPAVILDIENKIEPKKTLWIISSKSGGTTETDSLFHYFYNKISRERQFIAITDPGTSLEKLALAKKFRHIFRNPPDIGGRYSALSYFGLVPAALMGLDIRKLLDSASAMVNRSLPSVPLAKNPGAVLGIYLGEFYKQGRDKVTFIVDPPVHSFGMWLEQLLAESTGKDGKGLVPVEGEALGPPEAYGNDRVFIHFALNSQGLKTDPASTEKKLKALETAGHPVIRMALEGPYDLGGEFFRWEAATAVAGSILGIDPFDQPNVQESKDNTKALLEIFKKEGKLPGEAPIAEQGSLQLYAPASQVNAEALTTGELLSGFLEKARAGDYLALMAYIQPTNSSQNLLNAIRLELRDTLRLATTLGYGPRFLHSTGQLHKGGANNGLFIQFTATDEQDLKIPGEAYGFSVLKQAQALGDYRSLQNHGRRLIRIHLGETIETGLQECLTLLQTAGSALAGVKGADS